MSDGKRDEGSVQARAILALVGLLGCVASSLVLSKLTLMVMVIAYVWREPSNVELRFASTILVFG